MTVHVIYNNGDEATFRNIKALDIDGYWLMLRRTPTSAIWISNYYYYTYNITSIEVT